MIKVKSRNTNAQSLPARKANNLSFNVIHSGHSIIWAFATPGAFENYRVSLALFRTSAGSRTVDSAATEQRK